MKIFALLLITVLLPALVLAETKIITSEATYIMGDGETPAFAESMALQKAKQAALEEAGTYVQSYTRVKNFDLTVEEIHTLAGGVLQVEVLERTRSLIADGLRFYTKIKATVTTDKMEDLAGRIKGKNVAEQYTKLQMEYAKLSRELDDWKQHVIKIPPGPERATLLGHIGASEKTFARIQQKEIALFDGLISGKQLFTQVTRDREIIDDLLETIVQKGYLVTVGDIDAALVSTPKDHVTLKLPITIKVTDTLLETFAQAAKASGGNVANNVHVLMYKLGARIGQTYQRQLPVSFIHVGKDREAREYFLQRIRNLAFLLTFHSNGTEPFYCLIGPQERYTSEKKWLPMRRIIPVTVDDSGCGVFSGCPFDTFQSVYSKLNFAGAVAIIGEEAQFVVQQRLPVNSIEALTGVTVRVVPVPTKTDYPSSPYWEPYWEFKERYKGAPSCEVMQ